MSESYKVVERIVGRYGPQLTRVFERLLIETRGSIDLQQLFSLVRSGAKTETIVSWVMSKANVAQVIGRDPKLLQEITAVTRNAGTASAQVLAEGLGIQFRYSDPLAVEAAKTQIGLLVRRINDEQLRSLRNIIEVAQKAGLDVESQARLIREVVGLPSNWASAPRNFEEDLRLGMISSATQRRLSAADKAEIESRMRRGELSEAFIQRMVGRYTRSLINRRAQNIARTETQYAANSGQQSAWIQARNEGFLPPTVRRFWIVTPDERLRRSHAEIVVMNPDGVPLDEPFETPFGEVMHPPAEPNCRCSVGLLFDTETPQVPESVRPQEIETPETDSGAVPQFTSVESAFEWARDNNLVQFGRFGDATLEEAQEAVQALFDLKQKYGLRPIYRLNLRRGLGGTALGSCDDEGEIELRLDNIENMKSPEMRQLAREFEAEKGRPWSFGEASLTRTLTHEIGHALHARLGWNHGRERMGIEERWNRPLPEQAATQARKISEYAATNFAEFIAEAFVAYVEGRNDLLTKETVEVIEEIIQNSAINPGA